MWRYDDHHITIWYPKWFWPLHNIWGQDGISLLPPTCAHMVLWSSSLWIWLSSCEVIMMIIIWQDDHHLTIWYLTWFWSLHMRTGWMNFSILLAYLLPIQIWWSFTRYYSMVIIVSHYTDHQDKWVLMECLSPSSPAAWPTFAPNMTFATQLPLKKRQKKNRTLTKHSFNWAGIRMHMHRNLFNSKQVWITGLPVKRSVSYRVCHF